MKEQSHSHDGEEDNGSTECRVLPLVPHRHGSESERWIVLHAESGATLSLKERGIEDGLHAEIAVCW